MIKELKTEKIIELVEYAIKIKNGYKVSYPGKKVATLFFENSKGLLQRKNQKIITKT